MLSKCLRDYQKSKTHKQEHTKYKEIVPVHLLPEPALIPVVVTLTNNFNIFLVTLLYEQGFCQCGGHPHLDLVAHCHCGEGTEEVCGQLSSPQRRHKLLGGGLGHQTHP